MFESAIEMIKKNNLINFTTGKKALNSKYFSDIIKYFLLSLVSEKNYSIITGVMIKKKSFQVKF